MGDEQQAVAPKFRKTKTDKWAVMAPVETLQQAIESKGGVVEVLKKSGDWSTFTVSSLGRPFDVDGVQMCYGYGPDDEAEPGAARPARDMTTAPPPRTDASEPMPEYQGESGDEWDGGF